MATHRWVRSARATLVLALVVAGCTTAGSAPTATMEPPSGAFVIDLGIPPTVAEIRRANAFTGLGSGVSAAVEGLALEWMPWFTNGVILGYGMNSIDHAPGAGSPPPSGGTWDTAAIWRWRVHGVTVDEAVDDVRRQVEATGTWHAGDRPSASYEIPGARRLQFVGARADDFLVIDVTTSRTSDVDYVDIVVDGGRMIAFTGTPRTSIPDWVLGPSSAYVDAVDRLGGMVFGWYVNGGDALIMDDRVGTPHPGILTVTATFAAPAGAVAVSLCAGLGATPITGPSAGSSTHDGSQPTSWSCRLGSSTVDLDESNGQTIVFFMTQAPS